MESIAPSPIYRLRSIVEQLIQAHRDLATLLVAEREAKVSAWHGSDETTIQGRDRVSEAAALNLTSDILYAKGNIAALIEERDYLRLVISLESSIHSPEDQ